MKEMRSRTARGIPLHVRFLIYNILKKMLEMKFGRDARC